MILYHLPISLFCFKVRLALALKGVAVELREPPGGSYRSAEYRAINPAGTIPALVDGDFLLPESDAIIEYFEDLNMGSPLLPPDPRQRARNRLIARWCDMRLEPAVRALYPHVAPATRDAEAVARADARIASELALMETALDPSGPFATGTSPSLADCGLVATLGWINVLTPVFRLAARPGPRAARVIAAFAATPRLQKTIDEYHGLAGHWVAAKMTSGA